MTLIDDVKGIDQQWTPMWAFICTLKNGTTYYWSTHAFTWGGNPYSAVISNFSPLKIESGGVYGVDTVQEIDFEFNNADNWMAAILAPSVWLGGQIQPFLFFRDPLTATATTDSITYPKFLFDLPTQTWPIVTVTAHNKWNMARRTLPVSTISLHDRYPFPSTAAERLAAGGGAGGDDFSSPFAAIGYDPDRGKGNMTPGGGYYVGIPQGDTYEIVYNGTRKHLKTIGLEVRFGGQSSTPPADYSFTPKKATEPTVWKGSANPAKYGVAVPLGFGIVRAKAILLDTGFSPNGATWGGARLSHFLLGDGVNYSPALATMGWKLDNSFYWRPLVFLTGTKDNKLYQIPNPAVTRDPGVQGAFYIYQGKYGAQRQRDLGLGDYRNINEPAGEDDYPAPDFQGRDLYSGLVFMDVGIPKELALPDSDNGPGCEVIAMAGYVETLDSGLNSVWAWSQSPVWIRIHLLKLLGWTWADIDKAKAYAAAQKCAYRLAGNQLRFGCNLYLDKAYKASDVLRGVKNCGRMYDSWGTDGQLEINIEDTTAGEGGVDGVIDATVMVRNDSAQCIPKKFHKSIYEIGNTWTISFQDSDIKGDYSPASRTYPHTENINQTGEQTDGSAMFPVMGCPSDEQAQRLLRWIAYRTVDLNEFYQIVCNHKALRFQTGKIYEITEPRLGLDGQEARLLSKVDGPLDGTVTLVLQKHADAAYGDTQYLSPLVKAKSDSTYSPRSIGNLTAQELFIQDDVNPDLYWRKVKVEFSVPPITYEPSFTTQTRIEAVEVSVSGGSIPEDQILYVEVAPRLSGVDGIASDWLQVNIPAGSNSNKFTFDLTLTPEADEYVVRIGTHPGAMFEHSVVANSESGATQEVEITSIATLNETSLSPDPTFNHVRVFYYYSGRPEEIFDAGRTSGPTQTEFTFEPEAVQSGDTSITVVVVSANARETDFFPYSISPKVTITLNLDTGNPSGASDLVVLQNADDSSIPVGSAVFQFNRDTTNFNSIMGVAVVLSAADPAEGPFSVERTGLEIETGHVTVEAGSKTVVVADSGGREANEFVINRVLLMWTDDGSPDSDLEGEIITEQYTDRFLISSPFHKSGDFHYAIIRRWWDRTTGDSGAESNNTAYFWFPLSQFGSKDQEVWQTPAMVMPAGTHYATAYSRNMFGLGTRIVSAPFIIEEAGKTTTTDTGNPSGAGDFDVNTCNTNDLAEGTFSITFDRETTNYDSIEGVAVLLHDSEKCAGPYATERNEAGIISNSGTCNIVAGSLTVEILTKAGDFVAGDTERMLVIWSGDIYSDADLNAQKIADIGASTLTLEKSFYKTIAGARWAIIDVWWNLGSGNYHWFPIKDFDHPELDYWITPPASAGLDEKYVTVYSRNWYGYGTRWTSGAKIRFNIMDELAPTAPTILVLVGRAGGAYQFSFGVYDSSAGMATAYSVQFQIARDVDFNDILYDATGAIGFNGTYLTSETTLFFFRARTRNLVDWSLWSAVTSLSSGSEVTDTADAGPAGPVQDLVVKTAVSHPLEGLDGRTLRVSFKLPATNYLSIFHYGVGVYTSATFPSHIVIYANTVAINIQGGKSYITDPNKHFDEITPTIIGRILWLYDSAARTRLLSAHTINNIKDGGHTLEFSRGARFSSSTGFYDILTPSWEQVTAVKNVLSIRAENGVSPVDEYTVDFGNLEFDDYYIQVNAQNEYGFGTNATAGPVTLAGFTKADLSTLTADEITDAAADAAQALSDAAQAISDAAEAQGTANSKVKTWFDASAPTASAVGDIWFDLDDNNKQYRWSGSAWLLVQDPTSKTKTFAQGSVPTSTAVGDLWFNTNDSNKPHRAACIGADQVTPGEWEPIQDGAFSERIILGATIFTHDTTARMSIDPTNGLQSINSAGQSLVQITASGQFRLQSALTGARIEMDYANGLRVFDAGENLKVQISAAGVAAFNGATITGGTIQTEESGQRVVIDTSNGIRGINSSEVTKFQLALDGTVSIEAGKLSCYDGTTLIFEAYAGRQNNKVYAKDLIGGTITFSGNIQTTDGTVLAPVVKAGDLLAYNIKAYVTNTGAMTILDDGTVRFAVGPYVWVPNSPGSWVSVSLVGHTHDYSAVYAPIANGVTNGDSHDHNGGDGAQIAYSSLGSLPTLGSAAAANLGTGSGDAAYGNHDHSGVYSPVAHDHSGVYSPVAHDHSGVYAAAAIVSGNLLAIGVDCAASIKTSGASDDLGVVAGYSFAILGVSYVVNHSCCFIGSGGVDTTGDVKLDGSLYIGTTPLSESQLGQLLALIAHDHGGSTGTTDDHSHTISNTP